MKAIRALARGALRSFPSNFRRQFEEEILWDVEAEPERIARNLFALLKDGIALHIDDFARDLNYAISRLRRAPLFVAIVVLTFALGIGANVAVFSTLNAVVLRPLPFANSDRLVAVVAKTPRNDSGSGPLSLRDIADIREQIHGIASISGIDSGESTMTMNGIPKRLGGAAVTSGFFSTIGAVPELGRFFQRSDGLGGQHNAIISDHLWHTSFNGDPNILGKQISLNGISYAIVGVALPDAQTPNPHPLVGRLLQLDVFTVKPDASATAERTARINGVVASLAPGTTIAQLNAELLLVSQRLQQLYPRSNAQTIFFARSLTDQFIGPVASSLWTVVFAILGILLIACANVANLIATRWSAREREIAIRRALGASGRRVAAQLFIETGVLAVCGGVAGVALTYLSLRFIPLTALEGLPRVHSIGIDGTTLLYALLMVCLTTVFSGLAPVLSLGRTELTLVLNSAGRGGDASRGNGLRSALVVAEVALALALVISSGLVVRSYIALTTTPLGIQPDGVYETRFVRLSSSRYPTRQSRAQAEGQLLSHIEALPGVDAGALAISYPLSDLSLAFAPRAFGKSYSQGPDVLAAMNTVSPDYFRALGIPLLRGRAFTNHDSATQPPVVIVNQAFVDKFLQGSDGVNQRIFDAHDRSAKITLYPVVGVVANARQQLTTPMLPTAYFPIAQQSAASDISAIVRAPHSDLRNAQKELQTAFAAVLPESQPPEVYTVSSRIAEVTRTERSAATLLGALAVIPLLLALSGIFGVVSFSVGQRSREFGIRIALGARAHNILGAVLRVFLSITGVGVAIGTVLAAFAARAIAPHITISPLDPLTFGVVIALVVLSAAIAATVPALRATRVDPVVALRYE